MGDAKNCRGNIVIKRIFTLLIALAALVGMVGSRARR